MKFREWLPWPFGTHQHWLMWIAYSWIVFQLAFLLTGGLLARFHIGCELFKCR